MIHIGGDGAEIRAVQDVGCLRAVKLVYYFPRPIIPNVINCFEDCDIVLREFSKTIRLAKDLVSVRRRGEFTADFIIGGTRAVVYFNGSTARPPLAAIYAFTGRLGSIGYNRILYSDGPRPQCDRCPIRSIKGCSGVTSV